MKVKELKNLLIDNVEIGDLILAKADLKALDSGFQEAGVETEEWVTDQLSLVTEEIVRRNKTELLKRLKMARSRRSAISSVDEKRQKLDIEIEELQKKLGG
jgi:hypothetical protein